MTYGKSPKTQAWREPATGVSLEENRRALRARGTITWLLISLFVFVFCLGVFFGLFAGRIGA